MLQKRCRLEPITWLLLLLTKSVEVPSSVRRGRLRWWGRGGGTGDAGGGRFSKALMPLMSGVGSQVLGGEGGGMYRALKEVEHRVLCPLTFLAQVSGRQTHPVAWVVAGLKVWQHGPENTRELVLLSVDLRRGNIEDFVRRCASQVGFVSWGVDVFDYFLAFLWWGLIVCEILLKFW